MGTVFVDNIKHQSSQGSGTITVGASGETVNIPAGATLTNSGTNNLLTPIVSVRTSGAQTISDASATLIAMATEDVDTDNAFDNTAGNYKFTVPSGKAGKYMVTLMLTSFNEGSDIIQFQSLIYKNGSVVARIRQRHDDGSSAPARHEGATAHWLGDLAVGDFIQFYAYLDVSSNQPVINGSTETRGTIVKVG
mgnify:FL=1